MRQLPKLGILTCGGDCPGLNAVIRGVVKAGQQLGYETLGFRRGFEGLVDPVTYVPLTPDNTMSILSTGGTILGSTNKGRFVATQGVDTRVALPAELLREVGRTIRQLDLTGLVVVGGDGSLTIAQQLHQAGIPLVGVPKTIDNDLAATAFTFGFDSAIACATDALDRLHTTAASHERVMILEVMGRHAGWIALHAGIAGGADVILIPEIPWTYDQVCRKIIERDKHNQHFTLIVVAEGAHLPNGSLVIEERSAAGGQDRLGGVGSKIALEIERRLGRETRTCVLGHLQRGGKPTSFDRMLATQLGVHAVRLVSEGRFGEMVCYRPPHVQSVELSEAINHLSKVDPCGSAVQSARALDISFGDTPPGENPFTRRPEATSVATVDSLQEALQAAVLLDF